MNSHFQSVNPATREMYEAYTNADRVQTSLVRSALVLRLQAPDYVNMTADNVLEFFKGKCYIPDREFQSRAETAHSMFCT